MEDNFLGSIIILNGLLIKKKEEANNELLLNYIIHEHYPYGFDFVELFLTEQNLSQFRGTLYL